MSTGHLTGRGARARRSCTWPALLSALSLLCGCEDEPAAPPPPRFEAVAAKHPAASDLEGFCDVHAEPGQGPLLSLPALEGDQELPRSSAMWINLWATWCEPCIEEMPMIAAWQKRLGDAGKPIAVRFVSVDETADAVESFRAQHPDSPATARLADPSSLPSLVEELGLDTGAGLPIQVFADRSARVRCVRAGAVTPSHYPIVAGIL